MSVIPSFGRPKIEVEPVESGMSAEALALVASYGLKDSNLNLIAFGERASRDIRPSYLLPEVVPTPVEIASTQAPPRTLREIFKDSPQAAYLPLMPVAPPEALPAPAELTETTLVPEADSETDISAYRLNIQQFGFNSLKKATPLLKRARAAIVSARHKVSDAYLKASTQLTNLDLSGATERFSEIKDKPNTKKMAVAAGVGLLAVGAAVIAHKYGYSGGHSAHTHEAAQQLAPKAPHQTLEAAHVIKNPAAQPLKHVVKATAKIKEVKERLSYNGDTVWSHVHNRLQTQLGHNPSDALVHRVTANVLKLNHLNWDSARQLPKGSVIKLPLKIT